MKKFGKMKILTAVVLLALLVLPLSACFGGGNGEYIYTLKRNDTYELSGVAKRSTDYFALEVPVKHKGKDVTSIGSYAFVGNNFLTDLSFAEGSKVTRFGEHAFVSCENLVSIMLPEELTGFDESVFSNSSKIVEIYNLTGKTLEEGTPYKDTLSYYAKDVFTSREDKSKLKKDGDFRYHEEGETLALVEYTGDQSVVTIPSEMTQIESRAFNKNNKVQKIDFEAESKMKTIKYYAFLNCSKLVSLIIPETVTSLGSPLGANALSEVYNLALGSAFLFANDVLDATFEHRSLSEKSKLTFTDDGFVYADHDGKKMLVSYAGDAQEVVIPKDVEEIRELAFWGSDDLVKVSFESGSKVTRLRDYTFLENKSLASVKLPDTDVHVESGAFLICTALVEVFADARYASNTDFVKFLQQEAIVHKDLNAKSVVSVDKKGFITAVREEERVVDGNIEKEKEVILLGYTGEETTITLPSNVTVVAKTAFMERSELQSIIIPKSVKEIEREAFSYCANVKEVIFEKGSMLETIGTYAFVSAANLHEITIPSKVTSIEALAFLHCDNLTRAIFEDTTGWYIKTDGSNVKESVDASDEIAMADWFDKAGFFLQELVKE